MDRNFNVVLSCYKLPENTGGSNEFWFYLYYVHHVRVHPHGAPLRHQGRHPAGRTCPAARGSAREFSRPRVLVHTATPSLIDINVASTRARLHRALVLRGAQRRGTAGDGCVRVRRPARRRAHTGGGHRLTAVRAAQLPQVAAAVSPGVACGRWMIAARCSAPWSSTTTRPAACCSSPYPGVQQLAPSPQPGQPPGRPCCRCCRYCTRPRHRQGPRPFHDRELSHCCGTRDGVQQVHTWPHY